MTTEADRTDGVQSVPLWLGPPDRPLFAWLDVPVDGLVAGAAVLCPTMGLESAYSARAFRDLAHRLASTGWAALRVDYAGTGDSAGAWTDPDLVEEWLRGIRGAIDHVTALGAARVAVVGLRLGATLAAAELVRGGGVDDLVLWDPCATGRAFLREQRALSAFGRDETGDTGAAREEVPGASSAVDDGLVEAPGVVFAGTTVAALEPLAVAPSDRGLASRELVLGRQGRRLERVLAERRSLPHVEFAEISGQEDLLEDLAITPEPTLERIVSWLTEPGGSAARLDVPAPRTVAAFRMEGRPGVIERPVQLGPARLFGILTEPEEQADPSAPTVVFLNVGRIPHQGPARFWVDLARSWAAGGLRCLRVDLSGLGDSPTRPGRTELVEFPADALEDLGDIRTAAAAQEGAELIFVGLCSGADHAIEAALHGPIACVCVVNPALAYVRWGWHRYRRFEPNLEASTEAGDPQSRVSTRPLLTRVMARFARTRPATHRIPNFGWWIVNRWFMSASPGRTLERLGRSDVDVLIVAGTDEARRLRRGEQRRFRALVRKGRLRMEVLPDLDHSLLNRSSRDRVGALLDAYVARRSAETAGTDPPGDPSLGPTGAAARA